MVLLTQLRDREMEMCFLMSYGKEDQEEIMEMGKRQVCRYTFIREEQFSNFVSVYADAVGKSYENSWIELSDFGYAPGEKLGEREPAASKQLEGPKILLTLVNSRVEDEFYEELAIRSFQDG